MTLLHVPLLLFIFDATMLVYGPSRGDLRFLSSNIALLHCATGVVVVLQAPIMMSQSMRVPFITQSCVLTPQSQHTCSKRLQKSMMTCLAKSCN